MLYHNENDSSGIQEVLTDLHKYVPSYIRNNEKVYYSQGFVADQLSVERGVNALFEVSNGFTAEERLDGMNMEIADWHAGNKFLKVCFITSIICCFLVFIIQFLSFTVAMHLQFLNVLIKALCHTNS